MFNSTIINRIANGAVCAAFLVAVPVGASAPEDSDDIIVQPRAELDQWKSETSRSLDASLKKSGSRIRVSPGNAIVQVTFTVGDDGMADDVRLLSETGNNIARRFAISAVEKLDTLDEVPVSDPKNVRFLANIIFAQSERSLERLQGKLAEMERVRIASSGPQRTYLALGN